jgi:DnaJ-class molecular chaperone
LTTEVTVIHEEHNAKTEGRSVPTRERRVGGADATRRARTCRECGGYGRFLWGATDHGECGACRGTGRRF